MGIIIGRSVGIRVKKIPKKVKGMARYDRSWTSGGYKITRYRAGYYVPKGKRKARMRNYVIVKKMRKK